MTLKLLSDTISNLKHPNIPAHARPVTKFSDKDANEFTKAIIAYLRYKGHYARRLSSEGRYRPGEEVTDVLGHRKQMKGQWISGMNTGMSDVFSIISPIGRFLGVEIKRKGDRQRDEQKEFQQDITACGGIYMLTKDWDDFYLQIQNILK